MAAEDWRTPWRDFRNAHKDEYQCDYRCKLNSGRANEEKWFITDLDTYQVVEIRKHIPMFIGEKENYNAGLQSDYDRTRKYSDSEHSFRDILNYAVKLLEKFHRR